MTNNSKHHQVIGESDKLLKVLEKCSLLAKINRPILIIGERGTGKELIAARLHYLSKFWKGPYIKINCASLQSSVVESELFGHEMGSFTGAIRKTLGKFELANHGTLFLDEIGHMDISVQEKLLRVIEYKEIWPIGAQTSRSVNTRIIAATNQNLAELALQGKFQADLLDRLSFEVIYLPPLRERVDDILPLARHYGIKMTQELNYHLFPGFTEELERRLLEYSWPGNVRQLKNVIERAVVYHGLGKSPINQVEFNPLSKIPFSKISLDQKSSQQTGIIDRPKTIQDFKEQTRLFHEKILNKALKQNQYNQKRTARSLNLTYDQLRGLLRKYPNLGDKIL